MGRKKAKEYYCLKCDNHLPAKDFYTLNAKYPQRDGNIPICSSCLSREVYESFKLQENADIKAFQVILRQIDLPFLANLFRSALTSNDNTVGSYFRMLSLPQYKKKLAWHFSEFVDDEDENQRMIEEFMTEREYIDKMKDDNLIEIIPGHFEDKDYLVYKYNGQFTLDELKAFERNYLELKRGIKITNERDKIDLAIAAMIKHRLAQEIADGSATKIKQLQSALNSALSDLIKVDNNSNASSLAQIMKKVEEMKGNIHVLPDFLEKPHDKIDTAIWIIEYMNRENHGLPNDNFEPKDVYKFYNERLEEYIETLDNDKEKSEARKLFLD